MMPKKGEEDIFFYFVRTTKASQSIKLENKMDLRIIYKKKRNLRAYQW